MIVIILSLTGASDIWTWTDKRLAEAKKGSMGLETAITWHLAIKSVALIFVVTMGVVVAACGLSEIANEVISYFDEYQNDVNTEGNQKQDASQFFSDGTSAQWDVVITHLISTFYSYFVFSAISYGGFIFFNQFFYAPDSFACDLSTVDKAAYNGVQDLLGNIKDYDSCMANVDAIFDFEDQNKDGFIDRCEDASFQLAMGATEEYALKFSSPFSRSDLRLVCNDLK